MLFTIDDMINYTIIDIVDYKIYYGNTCINNICMRYDIKYNSIYLNDIYIMYLFKSVKSNIPQKRSLYKKKYFIDCLRIVYDNFLTYNYFTKIDSMRIEISNNSYYQIIIKRENNNTIFLDLDKNITDIKDRCEVINDKIKKFIFTRIIYDAIILYEDRINLYYDIIAMRNRYIKYDMRNKRHNTLASIPHEILIKILKLSDLKP